MKSKCCEAFRKRKNTQADAFVRFLKVRRHPNWMDGVICPGDCLVIVL